MDRTTINIGPGMVTWNGATIHVEDNITMKVAPKLFEVTTASHGVVDQRREDLQIEVAFTPKMWSDITKLFPYGSMEIGASLYGATDLPLVIKPRTGTGWTIANAAITKLPTITLAHNKPLLGEMTLTGLIANNGTGIMSDYLSSGAAAAAQTGWDLTKVPNFLYTATWAPLLPTAFYSEDGFEISFDLGTEDVTVNGLGTIDKTLASLSASCKVTPVGPAVADVLAVHGAAIKPGGSAPKGRLLIAAGIVGAPSVSLENCIVQSTTGRTGQKVKRIGEFEFKTVRTAITGVIEPAFVIVNTP
jgi:hypothetical protein